MAKYMGPLVENLISRLVVAPKYQKLNNPAKELVMREALKEIRKEIKPFAQAEDPQRFAQIQYNRLSRAVRKIVERAK
jgi:ATP-dependent helicase/DNAse subunit B